MRGRVDSDVIELNSDELEVWIGGKEEEDDGKDEKEERDRD